MRYLYSLLLLAVLAASACKKDNTAPQEDPDVNVDPDPIPPTINFNYPRLDMALIKAFANNDEITMGIFSNAPAGTGYTCEVTGSNGLKSGNVENVRITGTTGVSNFAFRGLQRYKDGKLTFKVTFNDGKNTVAEGSIDKEEFVVRDYKDLLTIWQLQVIMNYDLSTVYTQPVDIAFPDTVFTKAPVTEFKGTYDGQGHKITNLTIKTSTTTAPEFLGLFGSLESGSTIRNVHVELSADGISSPNHGFIGGIAGLSSAGSTIITCSVKGSIKSTGSFSETGGIIGDMTHGRVIGCSFNGVLQGGEAGGIVGNFSEGYINMCYAVVEFEGSSAGGILGGYTTLSGSQPKDTLLNSYAYILEPAQISYLASLYQGSQQNSPGFVIANCFSNAGAPQTGATMYSTVTELNGLLANFTVSNLPQGITAPPDNKPFKAGADPAKPASLWWE